MTIKTLAQIAVNSFYTKQCDESRMPDGYFYLRHETSPDWVADLIKAVQGEMLPDDYKYKFVVDALEALAEYDTDDAHMIILEGVDDTTHRLFHWVQSHGYRRGYASEALEIANANGKTFDDVDSIFTDAQTIEVSEVYHLVLSTLENLVNDLCVNCLELVNDHDELNQCEGE